MASKSPEVAWHLGMFQHGPTKLVSVLYAGREILRDVQCNASASARSEEETTVYVGKLLRMQHPGHPGAEKAVAQFLKAPGAFESEKHEQLEDRTSRMHA